jgi:transposase
MCENTSQQLYPASASPSPVNPDQVRHRLQEVVAQVRTKTFPYVRRPRRPIPWRLYTRAQTRELPDMLDLIRGVVDLYADEHPEPPRLRPRGGRPPISLADRLKALLAQGYLGLPNRPTEGEVAAFRAVLGVEALVGYKTVERSYGDPRVEAALYALLAITNRPIQGLETGFTVDGTGSPVTVGQHYRSARARQEAAEREAGLLPQGERPWVYQAGTVGLRYGLIAGWVSWTDRKVGELTQFSDLAQRTRELHPEWSTFVGDGAYSARWVVGRLDRVGVRAWILPRRNVTLKSLGEPAWPRSLLGLVRDPQAWLSEYHQRSRSEATWWSLEARNPGKIRKRLAARRVTEALLRAVVRNLRRLCYLRWLERDPKFTAPASIAS